MFLPQDSMILLHVLSKSKISGFYMYLLFVAVQPGLCRTWLETKLLVFLRKTSCLFHVNFSYPFQLFGHKKSSSMPIFASNLTMLEPTKGPLGSNSRSQETLIDTSKSEDSQVYTQVNVELK